MKKWITTAVLALATLAPVAQAGGGAADIDAKTPVISVPELKKAVDQKAATVIDANGTKMYDEGHVPGAISFARNEGKLANLLPKDKSAPIVCYCGSTMCSAWEAAATEASKLGYTNIKHLKVGIKGWKEAGMPTESAGKS